uniref:interferon-induced protein 44-like n=1 Tax=Maylandia zebra TaxID=106582 RepID=UPI000D30774E|nr:interferon-induced protein 44-like [Maylandia zebra]
MQLNSCGSGEVENWAGKVLRSGRGTVMRGEHSQGDPAVKQRSSKVKLVAQVQKSRDKGDENPTPGATSEDRKNRTVYIEDIPCPLTDDEEDLQNDYSHSPGTLMSLDLIRSDLTAKLAEASLSENNKDALLNLLIYLDDIVIASPTFEQHLVDLEEVLGRLQAAGLSLKLKKCQFCIDEFTFLGYRITSSGVKPDPDKYTTYRIKKGNAFYPFVLNDMMGLKKTTSRRNRRIHVKDVKQALKGHIKDGYVFNPENKLSKGDRYYNRTPTENDKVHVLVCVVDTNTASLMSDATVEAIQDVRDEATELEIPQVAIFTKIDEAFPEIKHDVTNVYKSECLQKRIEEFSKRVGIPINFIFPVKNYHSETELNPDMDAIIMNAMRHIIDIGNDSLNRKLRSQT